MRNTIFSGSGDLSDTSATFTLPGALDLAFLLWQVFRKPLMNISLVSETYLPTLGGIETHIDGLASALVALGHQATVVYLTPVQQGTSSAQTAETPSVPLPTVVPIRPYSLAKYRFPTTFSLPQSDVVHFHGFSRPLFFATLLATRRTQTPLVLTPHGSLHRLIRNDGTAIYNAKRTFDELVAPLLLRSCNTIVALTAEEQFHISQRYPHLSNRIIVIGNALPTLPKSITTMHQGTSQRLLILGRISREKRIPDLLEALRIDPVLPACDIAGPYGNATGEVRAAMRRLSPGRVKLLGPVYGDEKYRLLRSAVALVLSSESEMQSISALEAIACGTPVIASAGAAVGLGRGSHVVVYPTGDIDGLREAIRSVWPQRLVGVSSPKTVTWCKDNTDLARKLVDVYRHCAQYGAEDPP